MGWKISVIYVTVQKLLPDLPKPKSKMPLIYSGCRGQLKCDGTRAETRFRLSGETDESI